MPRNSYRSVPTSRRCPPLIVCRCLLLREASTIVPLSHRQARSAQREPPSLSIVVLSRQAGAGRQCWPAVLPRLNLAERAIGLCQGTATQHDFPNGPATTHKAVGLLPEGVEGALPAL